MKTKTLQHLNPIWEDRANFIIGVRLPINDPEFDVAWEQLWSEKISDLHYMICCIPFFAKDLSLGDEVLTDSDYKITKVIKQSGYYTFRVWFGDSKDPNIRIILLNELNQTNCLVEWYSDNLLGISCLEQYSQSTADILFKKQLAGLLYYETGKTA